MHRIGPEGPGRQVVIGGPGLEARGVRDLIAELALLPVEGGARVAIIEAAHRMNEDAQAALLKTLEEPPAGVTLVLCADAEEPLLPTIRSRCARLRLGPVGIREIEAILAEHGVADAPLAARLARIADGRPGRRARLGAPARSAAGARRAEPVAAGPPRGAAGRAPGRRAAPRRPSRGRRSATAVGDRVGRRRRRPDARAARRRTTAERGDPPTRHGRAPDPTRGRDADDAGPPAREPRPPNAVARPRRSSGCGPTSRATWRWSARPGPVGPRTSACSTRRPRPPRDSTGRRWTPSSTGSAGPRVLIAGNVSPELVLDDLALAWPRPRATAAMTAAERGARRGVARLEATARGRVQGVGFRYFILRRGMDLGVTGWVPTSRTARSASWRRAREPTRGIARGHGAGPAAAIVERVNVTWGAPTGRLRDFGDPSGRASRRLTAVR